MKELKYDIIKDQHQSNLNPAQLIKNQQQIFNNIMEGIGMNTARVYFILNLLLRVDKTFLYYNILHLFSSKKQNCLLCYFFSYCYITIFKIQDLL